MIFGGMAMFDFTFTLPGIAGMILSIGMAVDANVLIYERLREEIAAGKSLKTAIGVAYEKAFTAIFDSNLTSLITAIILFWMGSGTIKGFAVTLTIGIVASMFSAILVTRVLFRWGNDLHLLKKLSFLDLIKATKIDFLSKAKLSYIVSGVLILASIGAFAFRSGSSLGIDFTGGTLIEFQLGDKTISQPDADAALAKIDTAKRPVAQVEKSITGELLTIRCATDDAPKVATHLRESFPEILGKQIAEKDKDGKETGKSIFEVSENSQAVSATLGKDFLMQSLIALVLGLLGILIYITIQFEFSFALGGFIALLHDVVLRRGTLADPRRRLADHRRLFNQRHHRYLRPYPRVAQTGRGRHQGDDERGHKRHALPHRADLADHHRDRGHPHDLRRLGAQGLLRDDPDRPGDRHLLLDLHRLSGGALVEPAQGRQPAHGSPPHHAGRSRHPVDAPMILPPAIR